MSSGRRELIALGAVVAAATVAVLSYRSHRRHGARRRNRVATADGKRRVCVVCTGSVAAVKAAPLCRALIEALGVRVDLVLTRAAEHFQGVDYKGRKGWKDLRELQRRRGRRRRRRTREEGGADGADNDDDDDVDTPWLEVWTDQDEWENYKSVGDAVLHVDLAKRNSLLLLAPLCANTLSLLASGGCPNLATSVCRAWYSGGLEEVFAEPLTAKYGAQAVERPVVAAPAMNTVMWHQAQTRRALATLTGGETPRDVGFITRVVPPQVKTLACGDTGTGAMAEVDDIVAEVRTALAAFVAAEEAAAAAGLPPFPGLVSVSTGK